VVERVLRGEASAELEALFRRPEGGDPVWTRIAGKPLRDETGAVTGAIVVVRDIDEERRAENALRQTQQRFRLAAEAAGIGVWEWNVRTNELVWDAEMFRIYGLAPTPGGIAHYDLWTCALLPEERDAQEAQLRQHVDAGGVGRREFRIRRICDGEIRVIQATETRRANARGETEWVIGTNIDITERKRAEQALLESEERLRFALEGARAAAFSWDCRTNVSVWSPGFFRLHGLDPETATPGYAAWLASVLPEDRAEAESAVQQALAPGAPRYESEYRVASPDGSVRWVAVMGEIVRNAAGAPLRMSGIGMDVTDRKRAELALRDSEAALRQSQSRLVHAADAARMTYVEIDLGGRRLWTAENYERVMGYPPVTPAAGGPTGAGQSSIMGHVVPEDRPRFLAMAERLTTRGEGGRIEFRLRGDDGVERWLECVARVEPGEGGAPPRAFLTYLDITELARGRDALATAKRKADEILASIADGFAVFDADWRYVFFNRRAEELIGKTREEVIGRRFLEVFPMARDTEAHAHLQRVMTDRRPLDFEVLSPVINRWVYISASPTSDGGVSIYFRDISGQKEAERALAEAKRKADEILASIADGFYALDADWRFVYFNRRAETLLGKTRDDVIGKIFFDVFPMVRDTEVHAHYARAMRERRAIDFEMISPVMKRWVSFSVSPKSEGGLSVYFRDISVQKAAEAALRERDADLRLLADSMPQLAWLADADGAIRWYNRRWYEYTGTAPEQMEGWGWQAVHDPEVLPEVMARWTEAVASGQPLDMTFPLRGADGRFRPFLTRVLPQIDAQGRVIQWFGTNTEITEQKELEEALRLAKADAERANVAKSKFLASASHDLRQPVQSLVLLLSLVEGQVRDNARAARTVGMMKQAVGGLNGLLTAILDISRLDAGIIEPASETVRLDELLERLAGEYGPKAAAQSLSLRLASRAESVRTDPALFERALRNLIENALRYTARGGVLFGARRRGDRIRVDVIDTGVGVPAEKQAEIFEEFHQLHNPGRDLEQGLGLGLAIVSRLSALLDMRVEVSSRPGRGSRFSLSLPLAAPLRAEARAPDALTAHRGRILIVEDNAILRLSLEQIVLDWGFEIVSAASGEEAVAAVEAGARVDAIVTDYRLGAGLNGIQAALEVERLSHRMLPKLIVTGDTAKDRLEEIRASGCDFLHKPVSVEELRRKLSEMMAKGR
jgi:PAS domain S-box-containing protein